MGPRYDVAYVAKAVEVALIAPLGVEIRAYDGNPLRRIGRAVRPLRRAWGSRNVRGRPPRQSHSSPVASRVATRVATRALAVALALAAVLGRLRQHGARVPQPAARRWTRPARGSPRSPSSSTARRWPCRAGRPFVLVFGTRNVLQHNVSSSPTPRPATSVRGACSRRAGDTLVPVPALEAGDVCVRVDLHPTMRGRIDAR